MFLKALSLAAAAALAAAQPELSSENGNIVARPARNADFTVERRQTVDVSALADEVAQIPALIQAAQLQTHDLAWRATINATSSMNGRIDSMADAMANLVANNVAAQTAMAEAMSNQQSAMASQMAVMASNMVESMSAQTSTVSATLQQASASTAAEMSALTSTSAVSRNTLTSSMSNTVQGLTATMSRSMVAVTSTTAASIRAMNTSLNTGLGGVKQLKVGYWHGGCANHLYGGWNMYCLNRVAVDQALPYFRKSSNERFTAIVARGVYRVNFFTIGNSCNNQHSMLLINGANKYETHGHTSGWNWIDSQVDATFRAAAGVWWGIRTHAACGRTSSYPFSHHSRIEVHFLGSYDA